MVVLLLALGGFFSLPTLPPFDEKSHSDMLDLHQLRVSAYKSHLEGPDLGTFPTLNQLFNMKIVAVDHKGTLLERGGHQFEAFISINGLTPVGFSFFFSLSFL